MKNNISLVLNAGECLKCGSKHDLKLFHLDGDKENETLDNLSLLCKLCFNEAFTHIILDGKKIKVLNPNFISPSYLETIEKIIFNTIAT